MREIKFRAWDGKSVFNVEQITFNEAIWGCDKGRGVSIVFQPHIILMQFTGLHDKNGKEIYEGDIVNVTNKGIYNGLKVVVLDDTILCYVLVFASEYRNWVGTQGGLGYLKVSSGIKCELIGNIYETPELLNNKK